MKYVVVPKVLKDRRELASPMVDYMENYAKVGYEIVGILTCDGSPSCGITKSSYCEDWGGRPKAVPGILADQPGIYMEELIALMQERHVQPPCIYGLAMDDYTKTNEEIINEFEMFLRQQRTLFKSKKIKKLLK